MIQKRVETSCGFHTIVGEGEVVAIPPWVVDLASFRRWVGSEDVPETTRVWCLPGGEVWLDMTWEQLFSHNQLKAEFARVLGNVVRAERLGKLFPDGVGLTSADFSGGPDGVFVSTQSFHAERVALVAGARGGFVELEGTPDMVLEVVSDSSVSKDAERLFALYWKAGIPEYWLADARGPRLDFDVYRRGARGYVAARKQSGWLKSAVFGKSFRLTRATDDLGHPVFTLDVR
jgi:Uma2 family endonuclease